jgi:hypothetical protein
VAKQAKLDEALDKIAEALGSTDVSVRHGEKSVTRRSIGELTEAAKLANELGSGKPKARVLAPRRPKL